MGRMIEMDEARALVADDVLWPRVRDFLWNFAPQVHESWLEGMAGGPVPVEGLMSSSRVSRLWYSRLRSRRKTGRGNRRQGSIWTDRPGPYCRPSGAACFG